MVDEYGGDFRPVFVHDLQQLFGASWAEEEPIAKTLDALDGRPHTPPFGERFDQRFGFSKKGVRRNGKIYKED